jgi:pimeloyl-ACP methyl ester carboxylesterase
MRRSVSALLLAALLGGCSQGWTETHADGGDTTVISAERIEAPDNVRAWNVEYVSQTINGSPTTVTGWIAIPEVQGTMPILAWAHGTAGLGDECAPSVAGGRTPFHFTHELEAGWAVVATDYEGLGGPGLHPYLVSESEARSIFGIARAARELDGRVRPDLLMWGFSQGGHAVLSAAALAADLAPEFTIVATVAVAPAINLDGWVPAALGTSQQGYIAAIVAGFAAAYDLDVTDVLTPRAVELLDEVKTSCSDPSIYAISSLSSSGAFVVEPTQIEPWATLLAENSPERQLLAGPTLLVVGDRDRLWDASQLPEVVAGMCAVGSTVATAVYLGEDRLSTNGAARGEIHRFLADRLMGIPFDADC